MVVGFPKRTVPPNHPPKYQPKKGLTGIYYCGRKVLKC